MTAAGALQARIEAQQALDAVVYAQRALKADRHLAAAWASRQWHAGREAAQQLGVECVYHPCYGEAKAREALKAARVAATERLKAAKAVTGGVRQLRLALAEEGETHTFSLVA